MSSRVHCGRQRSLLQPFGISDASRSQLGTALLIGAGLALLATMAALLRQPRRNREPLTRAYADFVRRLSRAGATKAPHESALAFASRAARMLPLIGDEVLTLSQRYTRLRYAHTDDHDQAVQRLCADLRRFRVVSRSTGIVRRSA